MTRSDYPEDKSSLPKLSEKKPHYLVNYSPGANEAEGWFIFPNRENIKKTYLFKTQWHNARPIADVSIASLNKGYKFFDRDYSRHKNSPIRDLKGAPANHLIDQRKRAEKLSEHMRCIYFCDQDFLIHRVNNEATRLAIITKYGILTEYYKDGQWLISCRKNAKGIYYHGEYLGLDADDECFAEKIRSFKQQAEEAKIVEENLNKLPGNSS